mmetsp:Transcript_73586/g.157772  ORF Transcript_73586/g.157772 Transcript_73586/m.157772 type:complete len:708 (-) Transcript_73586:34-2157(-)
METSWQNVLFRSLAAVACASITLVAIVALIAAVAPDGPESDPLPGLDRFAGVLVDILAAVLLVFIAGVTLEREYLVEKAPRCSIRRLLGILCLSLIMVPILHLGFLIIVLSLCFLGITMISGMKAKLRAVVVYDGLLCLGLAEIMRRAGPQGQFMVTSVTMGAYSTFGAVLLPALAVLVTAAFLPQLAWVTAYGYLAMALHAAGVVLYGTELVVRETIMGLPREFGNSSCIRSTVESPTDATFGFFRGVITDPWKYDGPPSPCARSASQTTAVHAATCDAIGADMLVFFVLLGVYAFVGMVLRTGCPGRMQRIRVVPVSFENDFPEPAVTTEGAAGNKCRRCLHLLLQRKNLRLIGLIVFAVCGLLLGLLGQTALSGNYDTHQCGRAKAIDVSESTTTLPDVEWNDSSVDDNTTTAIFIPIVVKTTTRFQLPTITMSSTTITATTTSTTISLTTTTSTTSLGATSTTDTTTITTTTSSSTTSSTTTTTSTSLTSTITTSTSTSTTSVTNTTTTTSLTSTSSSTLTTFTGLTNTTTATTETTTQTTSTSTRNLTCPEFDNTSVQLGQADTDGVGSGDDTCGCGRDRGYAVALAVPAEQFSSTWCDLGGWAPAGLGFLVFSMHCWAAALAAIQAEEYAKKVREMKRKAKLERQRASSRASGRSMADIEDEERKAKESKASKAFAYLKPILDDPRPDPTGDIANDRVFSV